MDGNQLPTISYMMLIGIHLTMMHVHIMHAMGGIPHYDLVCTFVQAAGNVVSFHIEFELTIGKKKWAI